MIGSTACPSKVIPQNQIAMNRCSFFYRLVKLPLASSSFAALFGGPLNITCRRQCSVAQEDEFKLIYDKPDKDDLVVHTWRSLSHDRKVIRPGMVLFITYLSFRGQVDIVNMCEKFGAGPGGFYQPRDQCGDKLGRHMMCFGRNWDPVTKYEKRVRSDGSEPPLLPAELIKLTKIAIRDAVDYTLPGLCPDICLVDFYSPDGRVGLHQDLDESSDSLRTGLPVVSIFIGDAAEFLYGHTEDENKLDRLLLESGDVLIFGGDSRLIFHKVKRILPNSSPPPLLQETMLRPGLLNLTLKQY